MDTTPLNDAADRARSVLDDLSEGRWQRVADRFDAVMRANVSEDALAAAWVQIVGSSGALESLGEPVAVRAGDLTVTNTPLAMEAGDYTARIAFRDDGSIAGLHILQTQTP